MHQISMLPAATCAAVEHEHAACRTKQPPTATDYDRLRPTTARVQVRSRHVLERDVMPWMDKAEDFCTNRIREFCPFAGSQAKTVC